MSEINFTYYQSPLGLLKVAGTEHYITEISFIDEQNTPVNTTSDHPLLHQCIEELIEYFNGKRLSFDMPVHQKGTDFQSKVWGELLNIEFGKTISYMTLAKRLGDPNCIRAAAASNGKNHVCIVVPCHRVIGSNQSLVGYAGGLWRKKWLLDHENKFANGVQTLF
ncbi:methylated-DNA--[protein]-cysteine S-methyltransferase [Segetibacter aerophilus]|uniref:Methylated-DNA--protein-cysteine methyltransferase n=1 Tax=Segetibacter aerophilus TaxID=670293 RepID=A0A512B732_9BACT|nr:methylated-DNA--[protein]-cysteine S-methyltransferase [Segetibacter aerophilus]GEO07764.1 methylated-DNA--protein-cysteine methyltransferase [Segetibacter aerophilus]